MRAAIGVFVAGWVAGWIAAPLDARADDAPAADRPGDRPGDRRIDQKLAKANTRPADAKQPDGEAAPGTTAICIDQEIADRLAIKRKRRGAVDRLFVKQGRHEISASGGYYASDLLSGSYIVGGSYAYHMTDETAVEFAG